MRTGGLETFVVDAFTQRSFGGNPAGVVLLGGPREAEWMQAVAAELRHSETAFAEPPDGDGVRPLRWFTPATEVDLCGHATLATAHVLGGSQRFRTRSGVLTCSADGDGRVEMDFPADPPAPVPDGELWSRLAGALPGVTIRAVARGVGDMLVEAASAAEVRALRPDFPAVTAVPGRGVIVTAAMTGAPGQDAAGDRAASDRAASDRAAGDGAASDRAAGDGAAGDGAAGDGAAGNGAAGSRAAGGRAAGAADFVSRCFYPSAGIDEDPVTGSAHCTLGSWWAPRLGRTGLTGEQASPRGGLVRVTVRGDRVTLAGRAVTVLRGTLLA
jgi:predicted PhzF superfamily epimerase YddE/YHI9